MKEQVGLEEGDQRLFMVEVTSRANGRVSGKLHCGFCRAAGETLYWLPVTWYPKDPQQDIARMVVLEHFQKCPHRGGVTLFPLTLFEGEHDKVGKVITIAIA
ncbi:MAG: hypothetical protein AABO58_17610 [Acidobacteriota bacterium]